MTARRYPLTRAATPDTPRGDDWAEGLTILPCTLNQPIFDAITDRPDTATDAREEARRICASCPLLEPCTAAALATIPSRDDGIWAGMTSAQRARRRTRLGITA